MEAVKVSSLKDLEEIIFGKTINKWTVPVILILRGTYWRNKKKQGNKEVFKNDYTITIMCELMLPEMVFYVKSEIIHKEVEKEKIEEEVRALLTKKFDELISLAKAANVPVVYSIKDARTDF